MALRRVARIALALAACALAVDQTVQYTALSDGYVLGHRIAPFDPPIFCPDQERSLERIRSHLAHGEPPLAAFDFDPLLGWAPRPDSGSGELRWDWAGSRIGRATLAREKKPGVKRVVAVGDSFTLGMEVGALEAWPALVDEERDDLEVANLGMAGYGIDQALLRLERDGFPLEPDEVWFGWLPSATLRVATQYVPAMRHWSPSLAFKPRFELDERDELRLTPSPAPTLSRLVELVESQDAFLAAVGEHDLWIRKSPLAYAPFGSSLLHRFATTRVWLTLDERKGRGARPWFLDPRSEVYRLSKAILERAWDETGARGASLIVVILPEQRDLWDHKANGRGYWDELASELYSAGLGVEICDPAQALLEAGGAENRALWTPGGHYSAQGNRIVAEALHHWRTTLR